MSADSDMIRQFFYWMNERHNIYLKRDKGKKPPWTEDNILRHYKFTNVFRRLDRVSVYWNEKVYNTPSAKGSPELLFFNTILFRTFNLPSTWEQIGWQDKWSTAHCERLIKRLELRHSSKQTIFNGAYIISPGGTPGSKIRYVLECMRYFWKDRKIVVKAISRRNTMQGCVETLLALPTMGKFTAYEVACDLRETYVLENAGDVKTWTNPGPGCKRGLNLVYGRNLNYPVPQSQAINEIKHLLHIATKDMRWKHRNRWPLEMREIEHSLCEFQKYVRVQMGGSTRKYRYD